MIIQCKIFNRSDYDSPDKYIYEINKFFETKDGRDIIFINITSSGAEILKDIIYIFYKDYSKDKQTDRIKL
jgi:glycine cleavage system H lipoate-binding protein